jgi:predicted MPP superfamily phosphohydrolase
MSQVISFILGDSPGARYARAAIVILILFYAVLFEPFNLQVTENTFDLFEEEGETVKVVFISDLHFTYKHPQHFQRIVQTVNAQDADLVLIGGDNADGLNGAWEKLAPLQDLESRYGVYAVLGNHDHLPGNCMGDSRVMCSYTMERQLEAMGIEVLRNEHRMMEIKGREFTLIGVDDLWSGASDYQKASEGVPGGMPKVILAHNQLSVPEGLGGRNLGLSGHTHCGQVRIPFITDFLIGAVGHWGVTGGRATIDENTELYVTCGANPGLVRVFAPPEVSVIYLE